MLILILLLELSDLSTLGICDLNSEFLGSLQYLNSLRGTNSLGDLSTVFFVIHEKEINLFDVVDDEFLVIVGEEVSCLDV
jgi:hypothetical protein